MKNWFNSWTWLKCSGGEWNFGRFVAWQLFIFNSLALCWWHGYKAHNFNEINSFYQVIVQCSGYLTGLAIYAIEIAVREKNKLMITIGGKEYGLDGIDKEKK